METNQQVDNHDSKPLRKYQIDLHQPSTDKTRRLGLYNRHNSLVLCTFTESEYTQARPVRFGGIFRKNAASHACIGRRRQSKTSEHLLNESQKVLVLSEDW